MMCGGLQSSKSGIFQVSICLNVARLLAKYIDVSSISGMVKVCSLI